MMRATQVGGDHYARLAVQPEDVLHAVDTLLTAGRSAFVWYHLSAVIKRVLRDKDPQDLDKARDHLARIVEGAR
jgi:hypothetical protein